VNNRLRGNVFRKVTGEKEFFLSKLPGTVQKKIPRSVAEGDF